MMPTMDELPARPDRETGEPRPPKAPLGNPSKEQRKPWNPRKVPQPPEGKGPALEWDYNNARDKRWTFGIVLVLIVAFLMVRGALSADSSVFGWVEHWQVWAVLVAGGLLMAMGRSQDIAAGSDWFMRHKAFVNTYELTSVTTEKNWSNGQVVLKDSDDNQATINLMLLKQPLWDLVYNGIQHSVANGAEVNTSTVDRLGLYTALTIRKHRPQRHQGPTPE